MTEKLNVRNRWTNEVQFTAEITCDPSASPYVKLGLAVKWGFENRASLVGASLDGARLDQARLVGARLDRASLVGASLVGASLVGASLVGASLVGASLDRARLDGARLDRASLVGASLVGARLDGAIVRDEKVKRLFAIVSRLNDPYGFYAFELQDGGYKIMAGCRWFDDQAYRAHVASEYHQTKKGIETISILDFIAVRWDEVKE